MLHTHVHTHTHSHTHTHTHTHTQAPCRRERMRWGENEGWRAGGREGNMLHPFALDLNSFTFSFKSKYVKSKMSSKI